MSSLKVAVIGVGNVGLATAVHLKDKGFNPTISPVRSDSPAYAQVREAGGVEAATSFHGFFKLRAEDSHSQAAADADLIFLCTQAIADPVVFEQWKHIPGLSKKVVIKQSGNVASCIADQVFGKNAPTIVETDLAFYGCRFSKENDGSGLKPGVINVKNIKHAVYAATYPANADPKHKKQVEALGLIDFIWRESVLDLALVNPNPLAHPVGVLTNTALVHYQDDINVVGDDARFYRHALGNTSSVRLVEALEKERNRGMALLGYSGVKYPEQVKAYFTMIIRNLQEYFEETPSHNATRGFPAHVSGRYMDGEDGPSLAFWKALFSNLDEEFPTITAVVTIIQVMTQTDLHAAYLARCGRWVEGYKVEDIKANFAGTGPASLSSK